MQIHERNAFAAQVHLGEQESFLANLAAAEDDGFHRLQPVMREERIAVAQIQQPFAPIVDPKGRMGKPGVDPQVVQMVKIAGPARALVDFLHGDDVGSNFLDHGGDPPQIDPDFSRRSQPLNGR